MTAKIYRLPLRGKKPGPVEKPVKEKTSVKILLIVGQDEVRECIAAALTKSGVEVVPHKLDPRYYPAILLDLFAKTRFDVVIPTNLGIPFVYVPDLVSLTQKYGRGAGIVVISGWVQDDFVAELARTPRTAFFQAPIDIEALTATIRELSGKGMVRKE